MSSHCLQRVGKERGREINEKEERIREGRKVASKEERNDGKNKRRPRVDYILII